jgi:hypothetical protein
LRPAPCLATFTARTRDKTRTPTARKPNYSFERQERERAAALKATEKAAAKAERKAEAAAEKSPSSED